MSITFLLYYNSTSLNLESVNHEDKGDHIKEQGKNDEHTGGKLGRDQEKNEADWLKEVNLEQLCKEVYMFMMYNTCCRM